MQVQFTPDNRRHDGVPRDDEPGAFRTPHPGGSWPTHRGRARRRRKSQHAAGRRRMLERRARRRGHQVAT